MKKAAYSPHEQMPDGIRKVDYFGKRKPRRIQGNSLKPEQINLAHSKPIFECAESEGGLGLEPGIATTENCVVR
jgi:hypothetical protein